MNDSFDGSCSLGISGERLLQWRDQLLEAGEWRRIQAHVVDCATCQVRLAAFDQTRQQLRNITTPVAGAALWRQVQAGMTRRAPVVAGRPQVWGGIVAILVVAALVTLVIQFVNNAHPLPVAPTATPNSLPLRWVQKSRPVPSSGGLVPDPVVATSDSKIAYECLPTDNSSTIIPVINVTHDGADHWVQSPALTPLAANVQITPGNGACAILIDGGDANIAVVNLGSTALFITFNGGASWQLLQQGPFYPPLQLNTYHGSNYRLRLAVTESVLEVSRDRWQTWAPVDAAIHSAGESVAGFWIDPATGGMLAAGQTQQGPGHLWQTGDGGLSWTQLAPLPQLGSFVARPPHVGGAWRLCVTSATGTVTLDCSEDGGQHWSALALPQQPSANLTEELLGISSDGSLLMASTQQSAMQLFRLPAGATDWQPLGQAPQSQFIAYAPNPGMFWNIQLTGPKSAGGKPDGHAIYVANFP